MLKVLSTVLKTFLCPSGCGQYLFDDHLSYGLDACKTKLGEMYEQGDALVRERGVFHPLRSPL
jgi:hypothetical protein